MNIRPMTEGDIEPLHELYQHLADRIPYESRVTLEQFREDLRVTTWSEKVPVFLPGAELPLVAERHGRLVGFCLTGFANEQARWVPARTALIRFVTALPQEEEAAARLIREALGHLNTFAPEHIRAMHYWYGPPFYNTGCGRLTGAWPWIGHALMKEGFRVTQPYGTEIRMRRSLRNKPHRPEFPAGTRIHVLNAFGRAGPEFEHWYDLYLDDVKAGECHCMYSENFTRGSGKRTLYLNYLEVKPAFQGRGLARIMLREALTAAYKAGSFDATLTCDATNFAAKNLYRSEDYRPVDLLYEFEKSPEAGSEYIQAW